MRLNRPAAALLTAALAASSCSHPDLATGPVASAAPSLAAGRGAGRGGNRGAGRAAGRLRRLPCRTDEARTVRGVVGPAGGELRVAGFAVSFPAGAVRAAETFELSVVTGDFVEIEAHAVGRAGYAFAAPVTVTLNLAGCGALPEAGLRAYYVDRGTRTLLEDMGGQVDHVGRTLRFRTPHFSGYTVVWASDPIPSDSTGTPPADSASTGG